jgi:RNA polymerase sigma-70 factor (ECF subfamily)
MTPATITDRELTLAFQAGRSDAYDSIHERYVARVSALCRRMLGNQHDAQEATQETFVRVYQALGRFNGRYQLGAWIVRIATNVCLDHLRSRRRNPSDSVSEEILELEPCPTAEGDPEGLSIRRSEGRRVRKVLASMPPMHRAALVLRDFEGLSYSEIAVALDISDVQVKALIHRARQRFKRQWSSTGAAALLPWRLLQRFRDPDVVARDQVAQVATSWTPAAASCSAALQSCGTYVGERMAAALTVALVGTVAAVGGHATPAPKPQLPTERVEAMVRVTGGSQVLASHAIRHKDPARDTVSEAAVEDQTGTAVVPPAAEPEPAPAAQPTTAPEPEPQQPEPNPSPSSAPQPAAAPAFTPSLTIGAFASGEVAPKRHTYGFSCPGRNFSQTLETSVQIGDASAPVSLEVVMDGPNPYVALDVYANGRHYLYRSWGTAPTATWGVGTDSDATLSISGSYGAEHGSHPEDVGLPHSGVFAIDLALECDSPSVITERVDFQD